MTPESRPSAVSVSTSATETNVGGTATFPYTGAALTLGEEYPVKIVDVDANKIVWEKQLTVKG